MLSLASFRYDGFRERTAWAAADDGFLVIDLNAYSARGAGDGQIDQRSELMLSDWGPEGATDLQALAEATDAEGNLLFDTNGDGVLDANDTSYGEFRVWQDLDQDGEVDEGELRTLAEAGISQIYSVISRGSELDSQIGKSIKPSRRIPDDFNAFPWASSDSASRETMRC
ncbi:hypothetical protein [Roseicyclus amphidinii]|uniref:hypothetical protein n=1 Tax=Roseicyclus amphidinii TaxID=3034232 RepID=UPI0024E07033|nr:hypothetical protein [Roseicyclus sp. Amp-Y-6]